MFVLEFDPSQHFQVFLHNILTFWQLAVAICIKVFGAAPCIDDVYQVTVIIHKSPNYTEVGRSREGWRVNKFGRVDF